MEFRRNSLSARLDSTLKVVAAAKSSFRYRAAVSAMAVTSLAQGTAFATDTTPNT